MGVVDSSPQRELMSCFLCCLLPSLRLSPNVEPSSTVVSLEWLDVQPAIGTKVSDYVLQHKKVDEYTDTDLYTGGCERGQLLVVQRAPGHASCALPGWELLLLVENGTQRQGIT